ncbi:PQQ-dependent sugar dehydrogenase [Kineobactrum salinum]|uniref:PQQ-dependent sugar dehydrogenase n=1 Tax=Kineobactrum salinum TaxID=2708301 RepID=A0A6C0U1E4_9GAMM|nr:PQQ-dependent sugar dehydrogenase [Kineobactrum salinum]QIB65930.1 PQQ-dependent sugar dehydrogenase [Kineobactrum salinum]
MNTSPLRFLFIIALLSTTASATEPETRYSAYHDYRLVTVVEGLTRPWAMTFLPDGDMLVTEKAGSLRIVRDGKLLEEPVAGIPEVFNQGQGGLLDVVMHPDFAANQLLYLSYSKPLADGASTTAVIRGRYRDGRLRDVEELFEADSRGRGHYGSRIAFDGKGYMYITVGDRQASPSGNLEAHPAQSLADHHGVVVRLHEDGSIPEDNPFVDQDKALPEIWSYGHRNAQGLAIDRASGNVWITEHGPQGGDELNLVERGANYGWPVVGYGVNYGSGKAIHEGTHREGMTQPRKVWVPSIATSGLILYQGDAFPHWRGHLLAGGLAGKQVTLLELDGTSVVRHQTLAHNVGRVRDIRTGPDGYIYLALDHTDSDSPILRLEPVPRQELSLTD